MLKLAVITVSDRVSRGEYEDRSGPAIAGILRQAFPDCQLALDAVADEPAEIRRVLLAHADVDAILTSGGTGLSPRDRTPEVTAACCDREVPGVAEWLRRESMGETVFSALSRGYCGTRGRTLIVNLPGSVAAAEFCTRLLIQLLPHCQAMIRGGSH